MVSQCCVHRLEHVARHTEHRKRHCVVSAAVKTFCFQLLSHLWLPNPSHRLSFPTVPPASLSSQLPPLIPPTTPPTLPFSITFAKCNEHAAV